MVGGTSKKVYFESATRVDELDDNKIPSDDRIHKYLNSVTAAATANTERMHGMTTANKSKDDQLAEMMVRLDAKDVQMENPIAQLTAPEGGGGGERKPSGCGGKPNGGNGSRPSI